MDFSIPNLREFFNDLFRIVKAFMKAIKNAHNDIIPSFIVDNIFKTILLKIDQILSNSKRVIDNAVEMQKF